MNLKKIDEYNKMVRDIAALVEPVGYDLLVNPDATLTVTRKKPKVKTMEERVAELEEKVAVLEDKANGGKG